MKRLNALFFAFSQVTQHKNVQSAQCTHKTCDRVSPIDLTLFVILYAFNMEMGKNAKKKTTTARKMGKSCIFEG